MSKANKNRRLSGVSMHKAGDGTFSENALDEIYFGQFFFSSPSKLERLNPDPL
jgi:hypothetical protein